MYITIYIFFLHQCNKYIMIIDKNKIINDFRLYNMIHSNYLLL